MRKGSESSGPGARSNPGFPWTVYPFGRWRKGVAWRAAADPLTGDGSQSLCGIIRPHIPFRTADGVSGRSFSGITIKRKRHLPGLFFDRGSCRILDRSHQRWTKSGFSGMTTRPINRAVNRYLRREIGKGWGSPSPGDGLDHGYSRAADPLGVVPGGDVQIRWREITS